MTTILVYLRYAHFRKFCHLKIYFETYNSQQMSNNCILEWIIDFQNGLFVTCQLKDIFSLLREKRRNFEKKFEKRLFILFYLMKWTLDT